MSNYPKDDELTGIGEAYLPEPPPYLSSAAAEHWRGLIEHVVECGFTESAVDSLASYCVWWDRWMVAEMNLREQGNLIESPNHFQIQSPWLPIAKRSQEMMLKWATKLGMPYVIEQR